MTAGSLLVALPILACRTDPCRTVGLEVGLVDHAHDRQQPLIVALAR